MENPLQGAIRVVERAEVSVAKFITANDTGATGGHQAGFHFHKNTWPLFFDEAGVKGENKDVFVTIRWQDDFETSSRFIYYGVGTRNEYRLTRFGRNFPYLQPDNVGDLLVIAKRGPQFYDAFILHSDEDIEEFFAAFNISAADVNGIIPRQFQLNASDALLECFRRYLQELNVDFPPTVDLANRSRQCYNTAYRITNAIVKREPDSQILKWLDAEFQLFKTIENSRYQTRIQTPFATVEQLVETANTILNRRKSRAGKSLEHHLAEIFTIHDLPHSSQAVTEDNKKPDFIFPGADSYHNRSFNERRLIMLACKTTCKDRWRQVINEADRIRTKHLFTLQQGISSNQLTEMYRHNVQLVVPREYRSSFPPEFRARILSLDEFIVEVGRRNPVG